jgi:hypothetical protein
MQQADMSWDYEHPWFGAFVLAALPALGYAYLLVLMMETRFTATGLRTELSDLSLEL